MDSLDRVRCGVAWCDRAPAARGLCSRCYARYKRGLGPNETRQYTTRETKERVQALTIDEVTALRQALKKWQGAEGVKGPTRSLSYSTS